MFQKVHKNEKRCILCHFVPVTLLPAGRSRVIKKFSSRTQFKTSWPPLPYSMLHTSVWHCFGYP